MIKGGHYVAYVRKTLRGKENGSVSNDQWYFVSDQIVKGIDEKHVASSQAYILLYEKG